MLILLLTPSLSKWLDKGQDFVQNALCHIFSDRGYTYELDVLAAVVDRLPDPRRELWTQLSFGLGARQPTSLHQGREGVTFLISNSRKVVPDLFATTPGKGDLDTTSLNQRGAISFRLAGSVQDGRPRLVPPKLVSYEIEMPLANTVFHNGRSSTMTASRWAWLEGSTPRRLEVIQSRDLQHQRVLMPIDARTALRKSHSLGFPLKTLTVPWIIASAMGNIVREVYTDATASNTMPASGGLEAAVNQYFHMSGRSPEPVTVWALITLKERWHGEPTVTELPTLGYFERGSRLHRVLSGGGGYGKKKGLLSLDPDALHRSGTGLSSFGTGENLEQEETEALGNVAKKGDVIQFFLYFPTAKLPPPDGQSVSLSRAEIDFGTIPSTIDTMPDTEPQLPSPGQAAHIEYRDDIFGALSEQGMSLTIDTYGPLGMDSVGAHRLGRVVQTKLDVPFTRYRFRVYNPPALELKPRLPRKKEIMVATTKPANLQQSRPTPLPKPVVQKSRPTPVPKPVAQKSRPTPVPKPVERASKVKKSADKDAPAMTLEEALSALRPQPLQ